MHWRSTLQLTTSSVHAETRRVGIPFALEDLSAIVQARPREPLTVRANGKVVASTPGALAIDATLHGPIDPKLAWALDERAGISLERGDEAGALNDLKTLSGLKGNVVLYLLVSCV